MVYRTTIKVNYFKPLALKTKRQGGFTLLELVIAIAIAAILSTGIIMATFQYFAATSAIPNQTIAVKQVQNAIDYIGRDAHQSQTASTPFSWDNVHNTLTFTIMTPPDGTTSQNVEYAVNNGILTRTVNAGQSQSIATNISGFTYTSSPPYISITSTVTGFRNKTESRVVLLEP